MTVTKLHLNDVAGSTAMENARLGNNPAASGVTLTGAVHDADVDKTFITVTLTEAQRVAALAIRGTPGGNGACSVSTCGSGADAPSAQNEPPTHATHADAPLAAW